jgi:hypothetical protein
MNPDGPVVIVSAAMAEVAMSINPPAIKLMEGSFMWSSFC